MYITGLSCTPQVYHTHYRSVLYTTGLSCTPQVCHVHHGSFMYTTGLSYTLQVCHVHHRTHVGHRSIMYTRVLSYTLQACHVHYSSLMYTTGLSCTSQIYHIQHIRVVYTTVEFAILLSYSGENTLLPRLTALIETTRGTSVNSDLSPIVLQRPLSDDPSVCFPSADEAARPVMMNLNQEFAARPVRLLLPQRARIQLAFPVAAISIFLDPARRADPK